MTRPGVYRHFRGDMYRVLFTARNTTSGVDYAQHMVVYVSLYTGGTVSCREVLEFNDYVTTEGGEKVKRFEFQHI